MLVLACPPGNGGYAIDLGAAFRELVGFVAVRRRRRAAADELAGRVPDRAMRARIEAGRRFVEDDQRRAPARALK